MSKEVKCITKSSSNGSHEHITHIGNNGEGWKKTKEEAIRAIDADPNAFYTVDKTTGKRVYVGVVRNDSGKAPYLRTHADGKWNDNLLALPTC